MNLHINNLVCLFSVIEIRSLGGNVVPYKNFNPGNPYHCDMFGITGNQAESLFTPVVPNPSLNS